MTNKGVKTMINKVEYGKLQWPIDHKEKYKEFKNIEEAQVWGMSHYKQWAEQYKATMKVASHAIKGSLCTSPLESYCGNEYQGINQFMRNGTDNKGNKYRGLSDILTIVLCSAPRIPCNLVLYRLVNKEFIETLIERNKRNTPLPIQEKGFMSTSLLKDIADKSESYVTGNNLLEIYVPKETVGVYVNGVTRRNEEEVLLLPNMSLGLSSYPYKENGKKVFECQLIKFY